MKHLTTVLLLLCCCVTAFGQASWRYYFEFALVDKQGNSLSAEQIRTGEYQVFSTSVDPSVIFKYVPISGRFSLSGGAISPDIAIGLVHGYDTTIVEIPGGTLGIYLSNWPTESGLYDLNEKRIYNNEKQAYMMTISNWKRYRVENTVLRNKKLYFRDIEFSRRVVLQ